MDIYIISHQKYKFQHFLINKRSNKMTKIRNFNLTLILLSQVVKAFLLVGNQNLIDLKKENWID